MQLQNYKGKRTRQIDEQILTLNTVGRGTTITVRTLGPRTGPHGNVMGNHPPWALFENPTRIRVARLIGDRCTMIRVVLVHTRNFAILPYYL